MNVNILRGQHQIGGSIVEISTNEARIIFDVGINLRHKVVEPNMPNENEKVLYTGDFRANGRLDFSCFLNKLPVVDTLIIEGTTLSRVFMTGGDNQYEMLKEFENKKIGKIDLISYKNKKLYILELKKPDSVETMLRCVLEAYTYYATVDSKKLLADFQLPFDTVIVPSAFIFKGSLPDKEFSEKRPVLKKLMNELGVTVHYVKERF